MKGGHTVQRAHAFLTLGDFHVLLSALDAHLRSLRSLKRESTGYQELYTKMEIGVVTMNAGTPETLDLSHEELRLLLTALMEVHAALSRLGPEGGQFLEQDQLLIGENIARVQGILLATLLSANGGKKAQLHA